MTERLPDFVDFEDQVQGIEDLRLRTFSRAVLYLVGDIGAISFSHTQPFWSGKHY